MKTVRWKRLLHAHNLDQLQRVIQQLEALDIHYAIGSHRPWKALAREPWLMVPAADLHRAANLYSNRGR